MAKVVGPSPECKRYALGCQSSKEQSNLGLLNETEMSYRLPLPLEDKFAHRLISGIGRRPYLEQRRNSEEIVFNRSSKRRSGLTEIRNGKIEENIPTAFFRIAERRLVICTPITISVLPLTRAK